MRSNWRSFQTDEEGRAPREVLSGAGPFKLGTVVPRIKNSKFIPLAVGFSAGGFEHFLSDGPDNVFRMTAIVPSAG